MDSNPTMGSIKVVRLMSRWNFMMVGRVKGIDRIVKEMICRKRKGKIGGNNNVWEMKMKNKYKSDSIKAPRNHCARIKI